jgi:3' terminal RNA ribose 2'-O-methyltransferase Hen1
MLTITSTSPPATDLGFLLHKHPDRLHTVDLPFGNAHVFYPEASDQRCTAALLLDIDPVGLVRRPGGPDAFALAEYVSDRPYAASSFLSVALSRVFGTPLGGRCAKRPDLPDQKLALTATIAPLPCRGGEGVLRSLFEPLGYGVTAERHPLDRPEWGDSAYFTVSLSAQCRLADLLAHLYVLVPVLDNDKHYYVGEAEVEKLLRHGEGWLADHPAREMILSRYLKRRSSLVRQALERLVSEEEPAFEAKEDAQEEGEARLEKRVSLNERRLDAVTQALKASGAARVLDLGCGEGRLIQALVKDRQFTEIVGVDVSTRTLERASERLKLDQMPTRQKDRIKLMQGALTYRDARLAGFDAAALVEVIEHVEPGRLGALERVVFEFARPVTVLVTTPNVEHNVRFETLPAGRMRHADHRFEWTRAEFQAWAQAVASRRSYAVRFEPIGDVDAEVGPPTQMAVFTRA